MAEGLAALRDFVARSVGSALEAAGPGPRPARGRPPRSGPLDIAIPIFNNAALLRRCLQSLLPTLTPGDRVWLLDDASEEAEVASVMQDFARRWPSAHCVRNSANLGFVGTANRAFELSSRDIVLLNSDTEATLGWLEHLQACLQRNVRAGIVCPLSDQATLLSVLPAAGGGAADNAPTAASATTLGDMPLPTAVGFCMLIRRKVLDEIGYFSPVFAPGYGEENDLSMRTLRAGWDILTADQACVYHHSGSSFGSARGAELRAAHQAKLDRIWPEYGPLVQSWWRDNPLRARAEELAWAGDGRPGVVHVLHRQYLVGGTERVARTVIRELGERYRHTLLYPGETVSAWCDFESRGDGPGRELMLNNRWIRPRLRIAGHGADLTCAQSERALARVIRGSGAGLVHFHHMLHWDSLLLPLLAREMGCGVVISVHDFWFNCPIHNQLEHGTVQPCGRSHAHADERCGSCLRAYADGALDGDRSGRRVAEYSEARHALLQEVLGQADVVVVPSRFMRDKLLAAYALPPDVQVEVQPHGVILPPKPARPGGGENRVVGYFGGDQLLKGAGIVLYLARALAGSGVRFRVHGRIKGFDPRTLPPNVELRGFYDPDNVGEVMQGIDLALLPSHYEESFSMVASECWAHGVPVLASSRGALAERVQSGVNGWRVPDMTPPSWLRSLREVLEGDVIERCRARLAGEAMTSLQDSSAALDRLYRSLLARRSRAEDSCPPALQSPRFRDKLQALRSDAVPPAGRDARRCLGVVRDHWGTANYRVRFPLEDAHRSNSCEAKHFHVVRESGFDLGRGLHGSGETHAPGQVVIQPFLSDEGLAMMENLHRQPGLRVTLVVDDLWTALPQDNPVRGMLPDDVPGRLGYAASLCHALVLTTQELRLRLGLRHDNTRVIENALPEWIWGSLAAPSPRPRQRLRLGWAGAPQHAGDLAFLEPVMRATADLADWVFLGMCPEPLRPLAAEFHPMVPFERYPATLAGLGLDVAIAPLADHPFNRCKSHLKVLEHGILGVPVVAAELPPYQNCPVPQAAPNDTEAWITAIRHLLESPRTRSELGQSLRQWVRDHHLTRHRRPDWQAALGIKNDAD